MKRFIRVAAVALGLLGCSAGAQNFQTLYSFPDSGVNGIHPTASVALGPDGNIYGTSSQGGAFNDGGTAFRVRTATGAVEIVGHFNPTTTGRDPSSRLINIGDGFLYGVTFSNEGNKAGTLYRLNPQAPAVTPGNLEGALTHLYQIPATAGQPYRARSLTLGEPGAIHVICEDGAGIWRVPLANPLSATIVRYFDNASVYGATANTLTRGWDGFLYGTTTSGKAANDPTRTIDGTIFRIAPDGTGIARLLTCDRQSDATTGFAPESSLLQLPDGNFYGTMGFGGPPKSDGCLYRITPNGDFKVLHYFNSGELRNPRGELLYATDGYIYGVTAIGGSVGYGGIYRIKPNGTGYKILHHFKGPNGGQPEGGLAQGPDGWIYGTTFRGGEFGFGTVFRIKANLPELPENRLPIALDDFVTTAGSSVSVNVLANDFDPDSDGLIVAIDSAPSHGTVVMQPGGALLYTPDGTYAGEDEFTYVLSDGRGGQTSATVRIRNLTPGPLVQAGLYSGLLLLDPNLKLDFDDLEENTPRAQFSVKVSANGRFTGTLATQRKRVTLRGAFNQNTGTASVNVKIPGRGAATLFLSFQVGEPNPIIGVLYGSELWSGYAGLAQNSGTARKQAYTVAIEDTTGPTAGFGYGTMTVQTNGSVSVKGKLGDGTALSWSTTLVASLYGANEIPVFSEPLPGGVCAGYLLPNQGDGNDFGGSLRWLRPAGPKRPLADGFVQFGAGLYTAPSAQDPVLDIIGGSIGLSGGPLVDTEEKTFTIEGKKVIFTAPLRALSFNRANGLFSGKFLVNGKTISFNGAVNQFRKDGGGQFSIGGITGRAYLSPMVFHP